MQGNFTTAVGLGIMAAASCINAAHASDNREANHQFDRVIVIVMENYRSEEIYVDPGGKTLVTPFATQLATTYGFESSYFGVTHPSLPNYLAIIGGDYFGIQDDHDSCFNPTHRMPCSSVNASNLIDQLEEKHISWKGLFESMPSPGFLGASFPRYPKRYAQKHNPFVYFQNIALNPARLAKLEPFILSQLETELSNPATASKFIFIVPNLCNSQHGSKGFCKMDAVALPAGDAFLSQTVPAIIKSPSFTERSVLFIVWEENDIGDSGCCGTPGGGRVPAIVVTKHSKPMNGATPSNHYSLLATIEDGFDLPRLANAQKAATLFDVLPASFAPKNTLVGAP